jgi:exonuclease VII small subunit
MPISTDVRKYRETALEQGKVALDEARKPWYAAVGATDLAYGQLREQLGQLKELPAEAQVRLRGLQAGAGQIDTAHLREAVQTAGSQAREVYGAYLTQARETYESLAHRGELVVRRLRRGPKVRGAFDKAEELLSDAEATVAKAEQKATQPGEPTTRKAPARKVPAKRPATKA